MFKNKLVRVLLGIVLVLMINFIITTNEFAKEFAGVLQISFVSSLKLTIGALFGFVVGYKLFPTKQDWGAEIKKISAGGFMRALTIFIFMYFAMYYA